MLVLVLDDPRHRDARPFAEITMTIPSPRWILVDGSVTVFMDGNNRMLPSVIQQPTVSTVPEIRRP